MARNADDLTIRGLIEFLLKEKGLIDAKGGLKDLGNQADKADKKLGTLGRGFDALGKKIAAAFAVSAVTRFVSTAVQEFAKFDRSLNVIGKQLSQMGAGFDGGTDAIRDFLEQLERTSGVARQDLVTSFQAFLGITGSVEGAMYGVSQAADLVNSSLGGDLKTNTERLANLLQGEVTEAAKSLRLTLYDNNGVIKTQEQLLLELREQYGDLSSTLDDSQSDVETLGSTWNSLKQDLGERFAPVLKVVAKAFDVVGRSVIAFMSGLNLIRVGIKDFFSNPFGGSSDEYLKAHIQFTTDLAKVWHKGGQESGKAFEKGLEDFLTVARLKLLAKERVAARKLAEEIARTEVNAYEQGTRARLAAEIRFLEIKRENAVKAAQDEGRTIVGIREQFNNQITQLQIAFSDEQLRLDKERAIAVMQAELSLLEDGSEAKLNKQLEFLAEQKRIDMDAAEKRGQDMLLLDEQYEIMRLALVRQYSEQRFQIELDAHIQALAAKRDLDLAESDLALSGVQANSKEYFDILEKRIEDERQAKLDQLTLEHEAEFDAAVKRGDDLTDLNAKYERKRLSIEADAQNARVLLAQEEVQVKKDAQALIAQAAVQTITALFGESKAAAIAQAIVDTWLAVNAAIAQVPYPYNIAVAALVAAQGLANVHKIRSTDITKEKGFDDPVHDRLAYVGGRRWADDLLANLDRGFADAMMAGSMRMGRDQIQSITNHREGDTTSTLNIGVLVGDRSSLRKLHRMLEETARRDRARRVR